MTDALAELAKARRTTGHIDLARMIELVPTGRLRDVWDAGQDASSLLNLYQFSGDHLGLVRACLACATWARREGHGPRGVVTSFAYDEGQRAVDEWLRGLISATSVQVRTRALAGLMREDGFVFKGSRDEAVRLDARAAKQKRAHLRTLHKTIAQAARDRATAQGTAYATVGSMGITAIVIYAPHGVGTSAGLVAGIAAFARGYDDAAMMRALAELADVVRAVVPCPDVDALVGVR